MELKLDFKIVAKDGLPKKTGEYFVILSTEYGSYVQTMHYSAVYGVFNVYDTQAPKSVARTAVFNVVAYCELPQEWFDNLVKEVYQK